MKIGQITLHHVRMRLKTPVSTSFGTIGDKDSVLVEISDADGTVGWGESPAFWVPWYSEETIRTVLYIMEEFLIPKLFQGEITHPRQVSELFAPVQRNHMAKAGLESAIWDLYAKRLNLPLATVLGGTKQRIQVGVVVGIQSTVQETVKIVETYLIEGYKRVKLKIKPGQDIQFVKAVCASFPQLPISVDANGSYSLADLRILCELDQCGLAMIEQPLAAGDLVEHAKLQAMLKTPVCLDESAATFDDIKNAAAFVSCKIVSVKMSRLGGISATIQVNDFCRDRNIPVWCGGMFETGIGRAHNIALSTLDNFTMPGDLSGSSRYWERDLIKPEVVVNQGEIDVPDQPGIGYEVDLEQLRKVTLFKKTFR
ncbi:MAG: N-acylamino acid racemase [Firmicutes bacterium]|nr:N-acylamino acid racemase [Bacillota bacterium]